MGEEGEEASTSRGERGRIERRRGRNCITGIDAPVAPTGATRVRMRGT